MGHPASVLLFHTEDTTATFRAPDEHDVHPAVLIKSGVVVLRVCPALFGFERVTADDVRFARELVEAAREYLAELERAFEHDRSCQDLEAAEAA